MWRRRISSLQQQSHCPEGGAAAFSCSCSIPRGRKVLVIVIPCRFGIFSQSQSGFHDHEDGAVLWWMPMGKASLRVAKRHRMCYKFQILRHERSTI
jgi:hypothetical protein